MASKLTIPNDTPTSMQRLFLVACTLAWLACAAWMLFGGGITSIAHVLHRTSHPASAARKILLFTALCIYFVRLLGTWFIFLKRNIPWDEALAVAVWLGCINLTFALFAGANPSPLHWPVLLAVSLFLLGSWMNTFAEYQRLRWKRDPHNHGHLFTGGLFRIVRHPNYLGDLLAGLGLCWLAGEWIALAIPAIMLAGFLFAAIPSLDKHLQEHYGDQFSKYAAHTRKLIPFLY